MIEALDRSAHTSQAIARCDDCGTARQETCDYERLSSGAWKANEGQVIHRLTKQGWTYVKGHLRCLACEVARKTKMQEDRQMATVTDIRRPTREQKRQIIDLLTGVYDVAQERYRGADSDVTVADAIGGGCMFGWVAEIREELFGPDGRNEELEVLGAEIKVWRETADALSTEVHAKLKKMDDAIGKVAGLQTRVEALAKAAGPRAKSVPA